MEVLHLLPRSVPPPSTCDSGTSGVPFLWLGVCSSSSTFGGSEQDAGKRHHRDGRLSGSGLLRCLFLVQKVTGGWHPMINLLALNGFVTLTRFSMETVPLVLGSIQHGDVMFSIDPKDTYFQVLIHPDSQPYLGSLSPARFASSRLSVSSFHRLPGSLPWCSTCFRSGLTGGGSGSFATWIIG